MTWTATAALLGIVIHSGSSFSLGNQDTPENACKSLNPETTVSLQIGQTMSLRCPLDLSASCMISSIAWQKSDSKDGLRSVARADSMFDPLVFYVQAVMPEESGWYFCVAKAGTATIQSAFQVRVSSNLPTNESFNTPIQSSTVQKSVKQNHVVPTTGSGPKLPALSLMSSRLNQKPPAKQAVPNAPAAPAVHIDRAPEDLRSSFHVYRKFGNNQKQSGLDAEQLSRQVSSQIHEALGPILRQLGDLYSRLNALEKKTMDL